MKKKLLVTAIAGAMVAPSAFAAQDTSGMQYTSAAEGFYASIRARYSSGDTKGADSVIQNSSSRIGVRGTNDLGGGMSGFYQWELGVPLDNGNNDDLKTRLGNVGLRGAFGEIVLGSIWANSYNWTYGSTDIANVASGNLVYSDLLPGRSSNVVQYTTPDFNGFQASGLVEMNGGENNDLDQYILAANYGLQGFTGAIAYSVISDGVGDIGISIDVANADEDAVIEAVEGATASNLDDYSAWVAKFGYAQDNWYVNTWYSKDNLGDVKVTVTDNKGTDATGDDVAAAAASAEDVETFSIAGGISVDKVNLYAVYENQENVSGVDGAEDSYATVGVQYNLGSRSRVWVEYANQDLDSSDSEDDYITIGLRHDF